VLYRNDELESLADRDGVGERIRVVELSSRRVDGQERRRNPEEAGKRDDANSPDRETVLGSAGISPETVPAKPTGM
jgi:hypothetical protein